MLKRKLQYQNLLMQKANSLEKTLMLGKTEGERRMAWQRMRWLGSISNSMGMNLSKLWEITEERGAWRAAARGSQRVKHDRVAEQRQLPLISTLWELLKQKTSHAATTVAPVLKACNKHILFGFLKHLDKSATDENPILSVQHCLGLQCSLQGCGSSKAADSHTRFPMVEITEFSFQCLQYAQRRQSKILLEHKDENVAIPSFVCLVFVFFPRMWNLRHATIVCCSNANG